MQNQMDSTSYQSREKDRKLGGRCIGSLPLTGLSGWASVGEDMPSPAGMRCPRVACTQGVLYFSEKGKGSGNGIKDLYECGWE